jgi:HEAT repeat protein
MYNYFSDLVWKIDIVLLVFVFVLIFGILYYTDMRGYFENRRIKKLRAIKENVYRLASTKARAIPGQEDFLSKNISAQTFLDVATNRVREEVFFNQAEQDIFEKKYISQANIEKLQTTAKKSINKWHRIEAILALGYAGIDSSLEILKTNLFNKDEDISYFSALALCQMRNMDSARALLEFLKKHPVYRYKIASLLGQFPAEISSEVIKLTQDKDPSLRVWALRIIESTGSLAHTDTIEQLVKDESVEVRAAACQCLGVVGNKNTAKVLKSCLKDDAWLVRAQSAQALDKLLGQDCVALIISLIKDNSWLVIDSVKQVLIKHIDSAIGYLEKIFTQEDMLAKRIAVEIIELSGYTERLYAALLESGAKRAKAFFILEGMIKAGAYNGLDLALYDFNEDQNRQIFKALKEIDQNVAGRLENDLRSKHKYL